MALSNAGRDLIAAAIVGASYTPYNAANAHIGVGDGTGVFLAGQTDLLGANQLRKPMEAGFPTQVANLLSFRSLFGTGDANFDWEEWGVFNGLAGPTTMLNRKVESLGLKTNSQSWQLTAELTVEAA